MSVLYYSKREGAADYQPFFDQFEAIFMARGAPPDMALFSAERDVTVGGFVVPAATFAVAPEVRDLREWTPIDLLQPPLSWGLLIGHSDAPERFGITLGEAE